ncbi:MAG: hypothetical protein IJ857_09705 [Lachnospiraceae bacterium]|nr:hypothetical protein [Lachnospiraceae bacterium]
MAKLEEFGSYKEINEAAADALAKEDKDRIVRIARDNGLDPEDARSFWLGEIDELTTPLLAAIGKLEIESKDIEIFGIFADWKGVILDLAQKDEEFAINVRKKGKNLVDCFAAVLKQESENRKTIDKKICKAAGLPENIPMSTLTKIEQINIIKESLK